MLYILFYLSHSNGGVQKDTWPFINTRLLGNIYLPNIIMKVLFKEIGRKGVGMKWLDDRNIYYNNIGGSEGSNKTSKFLANKISHKWNLKLKKNNYFSKLWLKKYIFYGQSWTNKKSNLTQSYIPCLSACIITWFCYTSSYSIYKQYK